MTMKIHLGVGDCLRHKKTVADLKQNTQSITRIQAHEPMFRQQRNGFQKNQQSTSKSHFAILALERKRTVTERK